MTGSDQNVFTIFNMATNNMKMGKQLKHYKRKKKTMISVTM